MAEGAPVYHSEEHHSTAGKWILTAVAVAYVAASAYFLFDMHGKLDKMTQDQATSQKQVADLTKRMQSAETDTETLGEKIGVTKKELAARAEEMQRQQRASVAKVAEEANKQISAVAGEVGSVKTDVGGVKTDVASTKTELEATKARLESMKGDMGVMSGLIAGTRGDLEVLKHRGDRNYYEFTLDKSKSPKPVSTVSLQLKKTDPKRGKFTLNVMADDRTIEKKDRNLNEPIQFYTGREHMLYELVVWTVDKNKVTGYMSTPKGAPQPVQPGPPGASQ